MNIIDLKGALYRAKIEKKQQKILLYKYLIACWQEEDKKAKKLLKQINKKGDKK